MAAFLLCVRGVADATWVLVALAGFDFEAFVEGAVVPAANRVRSIDVASVGAALDVASVGAALSSVGAAGALADACALVAVGVVAPLVLRHSLKVAPCIPLHRA